ncbi:DegV family protein [Acetanaerobacterium elongatum]|uniref:EDD domain protein, DegV family n=1 Tax=Acetanaerobacterium elongatum TaxID=258515 RepID=A0A1G9ZRE7_9FIRM|nr:DegV family protein [Acetanaerobacterium elongatum]SDN23213.1 EDD domain protein, DegV family [Acetanaerobacterium elongatum]
MIKISADSTCDLSPELVKALDITITPLGIVVGGENFHDGVDIFPSDIFRYVDKENKTCKTAAVNVYEYQQVFKRLSSQYEAVIHICISADFSSCFQNASVAAQDFDNVYVVDSRNLSTGSGHVVFDAALMAREGLAPEEIVRRLQALVPKVEASFVIDRLEYLHKGGRCSTVAKLGANLLQLKPCIEVINGKMTVGKKYRGRFDTCLEAYVKDRLCDRTDIDYSRLFITHPQCTPETVALVKRTVEQYAHFDEVYETNAGCTVSNHCGPFTLGILFKRK